MELDAFLDDFDTDLGLKEEQLEEYLAQTKEMVDIVEVLEQAAVQKKEDLDLVKEKLQVANTNTNSTNWEMSQLCQV